MKLITETNSFNLNLFPDIATEAEIKITNQAFPNIRKIKANLTFVTENFFDDIKIFKQLEKLTLHTQQTNSTTNNNSDFEIKSLTIHDNSQPPNSETINKILNKIKRVKKLTIHNSIIDDFTLKKIESFQLQKLKLHNTEIQCKSKYLSLILLQNNKLNKLQLTSDEYKKYSTIKLCATEFLDGLSSHVIKLVSLKIVMESTRKLSLNNLMKLQSLKRLTIYYSPQQNAINMASLIFISKKLAHIEINLIEYKENKFSINNDHVIREISNIYSQKLKSIGPHIYLKPIIYTQKCTCEHNKHN